MNRAKEFGSSGIWRGAIKLTPHSDFETAAVSFSFSSDTFSIFNAR
jgi:hypothetical protein